MSLPRKLLTITLSLTLFGMVACGGGDPAPAPATSAPATSAPATSAPAPTAVPTATAKPIADPTEAPEPTAVPATSTPAPAATTVPTAAPTPAPTTKPVPTPTEAPKPTPVPPTATPVPPTATPMPTATPISLPDSGLFTSFSACGWDSSYAIENGSVFLSSTDTPGGKSVKSLNLDFLPTITGKTGNDVKNQSLGFSYHEYSSTGLDTDKKTHIVTIPAGKTPFKLDLKIAVSGKGSDGNACSTTIKEQFTRSDDYYPSSTLSIPDNAVPNKEKYKPFSIPAATAQGLVLATSQGNYNGSYEKVHVNNTNDYLIKKAPRTLRVGIFGEVESKDYETVRDFIEVLAVVAPNLDIAWATNISEITLPIHLVNCTELIKEDADTHCNTSGPSGSFSDQRGSGNLATGWGSIRISSQPYGNRHTLTHELGHSVGLWHSQVANTNMGPPDSQTGYLAAHDLMTISLIDNSGVTSGQTREAARVALSIADDAELQGFISDTSTLSNTPDSVWVDLAKLLKTQYDATK